MKKSARRQSRELATQGLYQWLLSNASSGEIDAQLRGALGYDKADKDLLDAILHGVIREHTTLVEALTPSLDRPIDQLSPVERAVLLIATFELTHHVETPYRVIINEAVELAKTFGGSDGYKYVNGVLDKLAAKLRPAETQARRNG
ncbi:TPA: transcription antitermination factor NusB [Burkholderia cepacia ATCC 25416]|uniref:transcription antitermination factor NusB n=1 Tax=Burkholderia cepacia TaxID=292 RepID=UPI001CF297E0|nr:transcription antitermination factor NusB [Burkholderia cepacia]HDR9766599.1 transcription antitermination factor NusB [Burkholderia cepacia ATCC 25416]MCA8080770.1 transcription antitermination factor NusB [Burkholderia cepacia]HDR9776993.1 transcription antitermination factor NusB [Burkholderia cepacia ATCC 25416]HDR9784711.1 transcription antitermination factor NusB [Burkholderia cepacia ATCC 25416]HDR9792140.1 transcription antitermination factor NusB [Burkholderia cepacia ATCC 25416]